MLLIASAAYITGELSSEIGELPPSFLPVGNKRLYQHQIKWAREQGFKNIFLSLPDDFKIPAFDLNFIECANVKIIYVPRGISLGESISYCWSNLPLLDEKGFSILHGDTLLGNYGLLPEIDLISVAKNYGSYNRAVLTGKRSFEERVSYDGRISYVWLFSVFKWKSF